MKCIIDSYAWVEYFIGSEKGKVLRKLFLDKNNNFFTVECCLAEIKGWALRNSKDFSKFFEIIKRNSKKLLITEEDWISSAEERFKQRKTQKDFGLIDSIILSKQKELNCKIITGDKHFKEMRDVVFIS
ncbi:PIN domain-containing protein [Candidatus Pacearchaeota archaeon]|nr:PIN domain-containing protein [Candidatus Pacearchaeota archaeon]